MKSPFAYFGGKMGMAAQIVALMPEHRVYIEPFFGSGAVLLAKPQSTYEIVNDIDSALVTFWRVLRDRRDELELACALTPYSRQEYAACDLQEPGLDDLEVARRWWVRVNQSFSNTARNTTGWGMSTAIGQSRSLTALSRLGRFEPVAQRMAGVTIECCDATDVIYRLGQGDQTVIYCDPPYLSSTRVVSSTNAGEYRHDMGNPAAHEQLAEALSATQASVILSGYPSELYGRLYADWYRLDVTRQLRASNGARGRRTSPDRVESLWLNYQPNVPDAPQLDFEGIANGAHSQIS